jgi:hypothetical protein
LFLSRFDEHMNGAVDSLVASKHDVAGLLVRWKRRIEISHVFSLEVGFAAVVGVVVSLAIGAIGGVTASVLIVSVGLVIATSS